MVGNVTSKAPLPIFTARIPERDACLATIAKVLVLGLDMIVSVVVDCSLKGDGTL